MSEWLEQPDSRARMRAVLEDFYTRVFEDVMIGFFFRGQDRSRLVEREYELMLEVFGERGVYTGRPLNRAHAPHPILGGHFDRRLQILRETLAAHDLPESVVERWIDHSLAARAQITPDAAGVCDPESVGESGPRE